MDYSTVPCGFPPTPPWSLLPVEIHRLLLEPIQRIVQLILQFRASEATAQSTHEFEQRLFEALREVGRCIVEWVYNDREPAGPEMLPAQIQVTGVFYRRHGHKTANRKVATLFGTITLLRFGYRPVEEIVPCIFPLEIRLGLECARATPALADRVGRLAACGTQQTVLASLRRDHAVNWSVHVLRKVTASLAGGMEEHRHKAQADQLLELLKRASASRGGRQPVLAAGRDGIFVPIRGQSCWREGAVATVSVLDRRGQRLGTVYLGRMPEAGQQTLSDQMTSLLREVLTRWQGPLPRLAYITDAGHHPTEYYEQVLCRMANPRDPRLTLRWEWIVDYYHACQYISKLAEALLGEGREALAWAAKMRRWLKRKPQGIHRVLHSAAALRHRRGLQGLAVEYQRAYAYLRERIAHLNYCSYRKRHLPIGSGVTEACCKTVFTQRMKQSGMSWEIASGQAIVELRVIHLSGIWDSVREAYLKSKDWPVLRTQLQNSPKPCKKPA
ncbi:MAG: hypothetical protein ACSLEZ_16200 [Thiobacillus sp.]